MSMTSSDLRQIRRFLPNAQSIKPLVLISFTLLFLLSVNGCRDNGDSSQRLEVKEVFQGKFVIPEGVQALDIREAEASFKPFMEKDAESAKSFLDLTVLHPEHDLFEYSGDAKSIYNFYKEQGWQSPWDEDGNREDTGIRWDNFTDPDQKYEMFAISDGSQSLMLFVEKQ